MKVLVACEISGRVRHAFSALGHDAWSCDISDEGEQLNLFENPEINYKHINGNVLDIINNDWDLIIAHPPCIDLCVSGARWFSEKIKNGSQEKSINFFLRFTELKCKWAIENPLGIMSTIYRKPDQIIQPWMFGHGECKATCLWLNDLPKLIPTKIITERKQTLYLLPPTPDRARKRSNTFFGIAEAMAQQWGNK